MILDRKTERLVIAGLLAATAITVSTCALAGDYRGYGTEHALSGRDADYSTSRGDDGRWLGRVRGLDQFRQPGTPLEPVEHWYDRLLDPFRERPRTYPGSPSGPPRGAVSDMDPHSFGSGVVAW